MSFTQEDIEELKIEAIDLLEEAEKCLLSLDQGAEFMPKYEAIFRVFHSLKGAAGMMEQLPLQEHMHQLENSMIRFKEEGKIPKEQIDFFLRGIDAAKLILNGKKADFDFKANSSEPVPPSTPTTTPAVEMSDSALAEFLAECDEVSQRVSAHFQLLEKGTQTQEIIDSIYRDIHSMKGAAQLFGFKQMGDLVHAMESSLEPARDKKSTVSPTLIDTLFLCMELIDHMIENIKSKQPLNFEKETQVLIHDLSGAPSIQGHVTPAGQSTNGVSANPSPNATAPTNDSEKESSTTIRVSVGLLDRLMTLMGEMVLVRNQVLQYSNNTDDLEFLNLSQRLNVVTSEIQGEMMKTRMQPIGTVIGKFSRVVRDLSKELGKKIEVHLSGSETELDKTLLEAVKDPLTHIIRNSCDHGIENSADRLTAGKPEVGNVWIRAFHEGGQVIIEVSDDGKGLHREKLLAKAIEKGIVSSEKSAAMSDRDVFALIFAAGFSTAAQVTNVSGRGVGMDVVRSNIERIGGSVELESVTGKSTTIRLKIPLTLAIVPAMIIRCGDERYAIPQVKLVELVRTEKSATGNGVEYLQGKPVYRLRGNILPLIDLKDVLGMQVANADQKNTDSINIVVLNSENQFFGLIVDEIQDTADIVVKPLSRFLKALSIYSGATVLGDGSVALILDVIGIAQQQALRGESKTDVAQQGVSAHDGKIRSSDAQEFLLFKVNSPTTHAVFLGQVHRLEEFRRSAVEMSGAQRVIRYRNAVLPIISLNEFLGYAQPQSANHADVISVVVTQHGNQVFGIEVNEILDVLVNEGKVDTTFSDRAGIFGNLVTKDEVITVVDPYIVTSAVTTRKAA